MNRKEAVEDTDMAEFMKDLRRYQLRISYSYTVTGSSTISRPCSLSLTMDEAKEVLLNWRDGPNPYNSVYFKLRMFVNDGGA